MAVSLMDILPYVGYGMDYLQRRGAVGDAENALVSGANTAMAGITDASQRVSGVNAGIYGDQKETLAPYLNTGGMGLTEIQNFLGELNQPFNFEADPGYQFRKDEMLKQLHAEAGARGLAQSGGAFRDLLARTGDLASLEFDDAYDRFLQERGQRFGMLRDTAGIGETAAGRQVGAGSEYGARETVNLTNTADSIATLQQAIAQAQATGDIARAQALSGVLQNSIAQVQDKSIVDQVLGSLGYGGAAGAAGAGTGVLNAPIIDLLRKIPGLSQILGGGGGSGSAGAGAVFPELAGTAAANAGTLEEILANADPGGALPGPAGGALEAAGGGLLGSIGSTLGNIGTQIGTLGGAVPLAAGIPIVGGAIAGGVMLAKKLWGNGPDRMAANQLTGAGGIHDHVRNAVNGIIESGATQEEKDAAGQALAREVEQYLVDFSKQSTDHYYQAQRTLRDFSWFGVRPLLG